MSRLQPLCDLRKGESGQIESYLNLPDTDGEVASKIRRMMEMGLLVGAIVEVAHEAPFGGDPFAVKVRGSMIALRRKDAASILVRKLGQDSTA